MASRKVGLCALAALGLIAAVPAIGGAQSAPADATPQIAQPSGGGVNWKGVGVGAATLLANVGYIPAKAVYAILGGIGGGAGYALTGGNTQTADTIWRSSLGGDYVLTPDMLTGAAPIHFSGPTTTPPGFATQAAPAGPTTMNSAPASTPMPYAASAPAPVTDPGPAAGTGGHIATSIVSEPADPGTGPVRGGGN